MSISAYLAKKTALGLAIPATLCGAIHLTAVGGQHYSEAVFATESRLLEHAGNTWRGFKDDIAKANGYAPVIGSYIVDEARASRSDIEGWISDASVRHYKRSGVSLATFKALYQSIVLNESTHNSEALSKKGAIGIAQIMSVNIETCGLDNVKDLIHPESNVDCGAQILAANLKTAKGKLEHALALYNWGYLPGSIDKRTGRQRVMPAETQAYITDVMRDFQRLKA